MLFEWENIDKNTLESKLLKEYLIFKSENSDSIIFFQVGNFIETYFQDAKIVSEITGIALGKKFIKEVGSIAMAGFPVHTLNIYIKQMLQNNHKVCVCNQYFNEEKDQYFRKLTRTYTKGTIIESEFLETTENNFILVLNNKAKNTEIAYADVSTGQFYKTNGDSKSIIIELEKIEPNEVLISKEQEKDFENLKSKYNITLLNSDYFNKNKTEDVLIKYCKETQKAYNTKLDKVIEYNINSFLIMDEITRRNLELTRTKRYLKKKGSLFWFLNNTKTPMGTRLLKKYIDEPLLTIEKIHERQKAIEEILSNDVIDKLEQTLENFCDLSRICAHISNSTIKPKDLYEIAKNSENLEELSKICTDFSSDLLKLDDVKLKETLNFTNNLKNALNENTSWDIDTGDLIKKGFSTNLDYLKQKLSDYENKIKQYERKEQKRLNIDNLKINVSKILGYYIEVPSSKIGKISNEYIKKQGLQSCSRYTTETLKNLEKECFNLKYQIIQFEYELYQKLKKEAKKFVEIIRNLAKDIARIDVLNSLAHCAKIHNLCKPNFNTEQIIIKNGYHPSLIKLKNELVENDTNIKNGGMIILTGANMSGKSTYLKHNAIICLLSQIGSFVPAQYADLTIVDKIFVRQGSTDDIINNNSSFMVEMNDLKFILDNITDSSLILLDEPAKSTNAKEGGAIARAFCEYILNKHNAKVILTTHNLELTKIEESFPKRAENYAIGETQTSEIKITNRKVKKGTINSSMAINTAILAELPEEIITQAKALANK